MQESGQTPNLKHSKGYSPYEADDDGVFPVDVPIPKGYQAALSAMIDKPMLKSIKYQEMQWKALRQFPRMVPHPSFPEMDVKQLAGAHHDLLGFEYLFIKACARHNIPMYAHNVIRDGEWQKQLHAAGNSDLTLSSHGVGMGMDIVHAKRHWNLTGEQWQLLGHIGKEVAANNGLGKIIEWGGDWKSRWDPAHWQIRNWRKQKDQYPWPLWTRKHWRR